ncbi:MULTISPECIES: hypothetical protein [Brucella/Ochrobactrum group]|jgi:hypothetical protein|uniref:DUF4169 family protein n=1 Tax=Brucella pseudintermedia TaxID=370111 RepID=A0ABY5U9G8_9HYPH|nr:MULTISPECIES: hypothetical protein [Brucella/Ochrobactrum group]KAB2681918.1 hypothetical protein F9K78_12160 [Brucella pseudintermedia]MCO7725311.1 hypothetical protein [Brucella intermedia]NKE75907.1 hypothetical protein [Ochrobactrum sp. MC-1LL]TWH02028.1 hypothetical protein L614_000200000120 [Ochrobactrum sp. J50]UWL59964.1 hypothetical protein NIK97_10640 [Brucella pseudintermedia]
MSENTTNKEKQIQSDQRKKRRAEELRANLMRRKAQLRSRRAGEADERNDGITAASGDTE